MLSLTFTNCLTLPGSVRWASRVKNVVPVAKEQVLSVMSLVRSMELLHTEAEKGSGSSQTFDADGVVP